MKHEIYYATQNECEISIREVSKRSVEKVVFLMDLKGFERWKGKSGNSSLKGIPYVRMEVQKKSEWCLGVES
jgi:hypothetical protein